METAPVAYCGAARRSSVATGGCDERLWGERRWPNCFPSRDLIRENIDWAQERRKTFFSVTAAAFGRGWPRAVHVFPHTLGGDGPTPFANKYTLRCVCVSSAAQSAALAYRPRRQRPNYFGDTFTTRFVSRFEVIFASRWDPICLMHERTCNMLSLKENQSK
jgi:hypothetical protein